MTMEKSDVHMHWVKQKCAALAENASTAIHGASSHVGQIQYGIAPTNASGSVTRCR